MKLLIIEDDSAVRITLIELMRIHGYECSWAENGEDAIHQLKMSMPDLIICDVNMPIMDGFEFTKKVGSDPTFAHVPIILLTADVADESKIKGLHAGAVDYIKKPFNNNEVVLKIGNILSNKQAFQSNSWQSILSKSFNDNPNIDEKFIQDLHHYVVKNIEISSYSVSNLATDLGISERNLYRRVNDLLNMSVAEYIREVKLQRAHDLLTENKVKTISEAAVKVGFKSISHFSRLYRDKFKIVS